MSKDRIFSDQPKAKVIRTYATRQTPYVHRGRCNENYQYQKNPTYLILKLDENDLKSYREVGRNEILLKDDVYYSKERGGWVYTQMVGMTPINTLGRVYYRKLAFNEPPYIDIKFYRLLFPSDIIQDGDEFHDKGKWYRTGNLGKPADIYFYRRKLQPL